MRTILLSIFVVVGVTTASEQLVNSSEYESSRTKRFLVPDNTQQVQIKLGFDTATHLFDEMDQLDFGGVTGALVGSVSGFLGAVGPFVGFVLSLFSGPSPEYLLLKRMFTQIENRFDKVDVQFAALRRQVAFVATQVHFTDLESNINAVQSGLKVLSQVTNKAGYRYEKHEFIRTFDRTYESSGIKLFNSIIHGGALTGGLFHEFMTHSTFDRKATQRFMIGTLNLLMKASAVEMTYGQLKHDPNQDIKRRTWISQFTQVKNKMIAIDHIIVKNYHNQSVSDINTFAIIHPKGNLSNAAFSSQLYNKLSSKYYWRYWFVLVSPPYDHWKLAVHACEYNKHNDHGRTIAVASRENTRKHTGSEFTLINYHLKLYTKARIPPGGRYLYRCPDTNTAYGKLPDSVRNHCNTYAAAGVACMKSTDIHIHAAPGKLTSYNPHGANRAFLFG